MKADKKDKLKDLLKLTADDKPSANFTASIMNAIEADVQREMALKSILQKEETVGPSFSFTANVMAGIQANKPQFVYKPIISKKAWYGIAAAFLLFAVLLGFPEASHHTTNGPSRLATLISYTYAIPSKYILIMAVAVALLGVDYYVNRSKSNTTETLA